MPASRSRSLDGLLDEPAPVEKPEEDEKAEEAVAAMLGQSDETEDNFLDVKEPISKSRSYQENLDAESLDRGSMLSLPNSDTKRKRNFMDKCVSKVRHLIKK